MHDTWHIVRFGWSAVVLVYSVLAIIASWRLRGEAKKRNHAILIAMAVLMAIRISARHFLGGLVYQFAAVFYGMVAGVAALTVAKMLVTQRPSDEPVGKEERIQSLKLS
jgi:uncharacterized membrane protein